VDPSGGARRKSIEYEEVERYPHLPGQEQLRSPSHRGFSLKGATQQRQPHCQSVEADTFWTIRADFGNLAKRPVGPALKFRLDRR
jgi:hypothetical protein